MTFSFQGSKEPLTVKDLINLTLARLDKEINTPIPLLKRDEWQKERTAKAKEIITILQSQLLSVSKLQKRKIKDVGKKMYIDVKQKIALAVETDRENMTLRQRISELDERAVAREKSRTDAAELKVQEQTMREVIEKRKEPMMLKIAFQIWRTSFVRLVHLKHTSIGTISRLLSRKQSRHWQIGRIAQHLSSVMTWSKSLVRASLPNAILTTSTLMSSPTDKRQQIVSLIWQTPLLVELANFSGKLPLPVSVNSLQK